jgi:cytoskeleton protein RodZ
MNPKEGWMGFEATGESSTLMMASELMMVSDQLRQARQAAGMTQAEVAEQLFLTETYIRDMDSGDFHRLPKKVFVRGYLRSYARVVGLDGGQLVQLYDEAFWETLPDTPEDVAVSVKENRFSGRIVLAGLTGSGIVLILVLLVWLLTTGDDQKGIGAATPTAAEPVLNAKLDSGITEGALLDAANVKTAPVEPEFLDKMLEQEPNSKPEAPASELVANFERAMNVVAPENQIAMAENPRSAGINEGLEGLVLAEAGSDPEPLSTSGENGEGWVNEIEGFDQSGGQAQASFNPDLERGVEKQVEIRRENRLDGRQILVDAGGSDELKATFVGECWIEVQDSQGELIYGDLNLAGDVLVLNGRAPLKVLLGNAPMASLEFNGRVIDLDSATTRDAIARLTLTN